MRYGQIQRLANFNFQLLRDVDVLPQKLSGVFAALPDALPVQRKPRAALLKQVVLGGEEGVVVAELGTAGEAAEVQLLGPVVMAP